MPEKLVKLPNLKGPGGATPWGESRYYREGPCGTEAMERERLQLVLDKLAGSTLKQYKYARV